MLKLERMFYEENKVFLLVHERCVFGGMPGCCTCRFKCFLLNAKCLLFMHAKMLLVLIKLI